MLESFVVLIPNIAEILLTDVDISDRYFPQIVCDNVSSMSAKRKRSAGDSASRTLNLQHM